MAHIRWLTLEHLHPLAATGTPTGAGPVLILVNGRGSRHPPHWRHSGSRLPETLNSALSIGVKFSSRQGSGSGSNYAVNGQAVGVATSPVDCVAGQSGQFCPLASPRWRCSYDSQFLVGALTLNRSPTIWCEGEGSGSISSHMLGTSSLAFVLELVIWFNKWCESRHLPCSPPKSSFKT